MSLETDRAMDAEPRSDWPRLVITVEGQRVEGAFVHLSRDDLEVRITSPFTGRQAGSHIPTFARPHGRYTDAEGRLTEKGRACAEQLLEALYRAGRHPDCDVNPDIESDPIKPDR